MEKVANPGRLFETLKEWAPAAVVVVSCIAAYFNLQGAVANNSAAIVEMKQFNLPSRVQTLEDGFKAAQEAQSAQSQAIQSEIQALQISQHDTSAAVGAQGQTLATIQAQLGFIISQSGANSKEPQK